MIPEHPDGQRSGARGLTLADQSSRFLQAGPRSYLSADRRPRVVVNTTLAALLRIFTLSIGAGLISTYGAGIDQKEPVAARDMLAIGFGPASRTPGRAPHC